MTNHPNDPQRTPCSGGVPDVLAQLRRDAAALGETLWAARGLGELMDTAFDLHRMQLYDALHLPRPSSAADEHRCGAQLTGLLWHGDTDPSIVYVAPNK